MPESIPLEEKCPLSPNERIHPIRPNSPTSNKNPEKNIVYELPIFNVLFLWCFRCIDLVSSLFDFKSNQVTDVEQIKQTILSNFKLPEVLRVESITKTWFSEIR